MSVLVESQARSFFLIIHLCPGTAVSHPHQGGVPTFEGQMNVYKARIPGPQMEDVKACFLSDCSCSTMSLHEKFKNPLL